MRPIYLERRLDVIGKDTIYIPGCEPTGVSTSVTLLRFMQCPKAYVKLDIALAAIPGSRVEFQINNFVSHAVRRRWFVLPSHPIDCPPETIPDYFAILRSLATIDQDDDMEELQNSCGTIDRFFHTTDMPATIEPQNVYREEGDLWGVQPVLLNHPYWSGYSDVPDLASDTPYFK